MTKEAIQSTLEDYAAAYCAKDIDALMNGFGIKPTITQIFFDKKYPVKRLRSY